MEVFKVFSYNKAVTFIQSFSFVFFLSGPELFSESFPSFFRRHGGGAPLASMSKFILGDFGTIFHDLENWPYNSPKILHAAPNR